MREWFGHKYKALTDCGIEGFWNDMNEPSLFYSPERLRAFLNDMAALREKDNIEQEEFFLRVVGGAMGLMSAMQIGMELAKKKNKEKYTPKKYKKD